MRILSKRRKRCRSEIIQKLAEYWGVQLASKPVCQGHSAPIEFLRQQVEDRPPLILWKGPRGGGKSLLSSLGTWLDSQVHDGHTTTILGGSLAQSRQIYQAMRIFDRYHPERSPLLSMSKESALFRTGSEVSILAASPTSVRGPHVATLKLDEVDEIDPDIRESAMGMCMELGNGVPASIVMTSTEHRIAGPMSELMARGLAGDFPVHTFCIFEVLERCPDERSGSDLSGCPTCPLFRWCHSDRDSDPLRRPKAKRSNGHYSIDSFVQKIRGVSLRVLESDYLCLRPSAAGVWFSDFDQPLHVTPDAEFTPLLPVHISIDCGVHTGVVLFQISKDPIDGMPVCSVFGEYYSYDRTAELDALKIKEEFLDRTGAEFRPVAGVRVTMDDAGKAKSPVGVTVIGEYERVGLYGQRGIEYWPKHPGSVLDQLNLLASFVMNASGRSRLRIHPRCTRLVEAFLGYVRKKSNNQWLDDPADPQHPHEEMIDALRGGLAVELPESNKPQPMFQRVSGRRIF